MRAVDILERKRDGNELSTEEIHFFFSGYLEHQVPDYQMASFLMAVFFRGMSDRELADLTFFMRDSGDTVKFDGISAFLVDKHSTGGVGDKVTAVLAPVLAALGMAAAKISGKGLGHTGGTIDKFESIKGFRFSETPADLVRIASRTGIGLMGQSDTIVPLDKSLYALRDVTATVPSIPLIAASIMSKKLAVQSDLIILDVKVGDGAFMKDLDRAEELARRMIAVGALAGRQVKAILSNMDEPLGSMVGNACEIAEAAECLKGRFPEDLKTVVYTIAGLALKARGDVSCLDEAFPLIDAAVRSGSALGKLKDFVRESGGDPAAIDNPALLPQAAHTVPVSSPDNGYVCAIKAEEIGRAAMLLGAGRAVKDAPIDHAVGLKLHKKIGSFAAKGEPLAEIFYNSADHCAAACALVQDAFRLSPAPVLKPAAVIKIIESQGVFS